MSTLIENEHSVLDLGCGKMWLKKSIDPKVVYYGVDYIQRAKDTIVCDFNRYEFPDKDVDLAFISGCLEYIEDVSWFLGQLQKHCKSIVLSYCTLELNPAMLGRRKNAWVNNYSSKELIALLETYDFYLFKKIDDIDGNEVFKFVKK